MHRRDHHGDPAEALFASLDWSTTPLGPADGWDDTLLAAVDLLTHTQFPATLFWGPEYVLIYNAAYAPMIGDKHPAALGSRARDVFPEAWDLIGPMLETVLHGGPSSWVENQYVPLVPETTTPFPCPRAARSSSTPTDSWSGATPT